MKTKLNEVARYTVIDHEDLFNPAALTSVEYESFRHCLHRIEQHRVKSGKRAKIDLRTLVEGSDTFWKHQGLK